MIAKIGEHVEDAEPFWPDELRENKIIYSYRFFLKPIKISKCFLDLNTCIEGVELSNNCFIRAGTIQRSIAKECRIQLKSATIPLGANVNVVRECKAQKMLEYLNNNPILVKFMPISSEKIKELSWNPLLECKKFYLEVTGPPYPGHIGKCLWSPATRRYKYMESLEVGDCILHYLKSSSPGEYNKKIVGVSRVKEKFTRLSREQLIKRLNEKDIWNDKYAQFAGNWLKHQYFYFVELDNYIEFPQKITLNKFEELTGISPRNLQRYLVELKLEQARKILELALGKQFVEKRSVYRMKELTKKLKSPEYGELIILLNLFSGKNVLLVGPPGSGKTSLLINLLDKLGIRYIIETGNPEWTPFDTIGGPLASGNVKKGFIFSAIEKSKNAIEKEGKLYWLIIDEINRANIDLAFGKFFTLLDPIHRKKEKLEISGIKSSESDKHSIEVPYSFRVLATMNNYDRALLFKLGYALTRRFAIINHTYLQKLSEYRKQYADALLEGERDLLKRIIEKSKVKERKIKIDFRRMLDELRECRVDNEGKSYDCIAPIDFVAETKEYSEDEWRDKIYSIKDSEAKIRLDNILVNLVEDINKELEKFKDCEVCPIQVTPGVLADALKYIAIGVYAYEKGLLPPCELAEDTSKHTRVHTLLLLDSAFSTYIIPQLDILADYANREKLQRGTVRARGSSKKGSIIDILGNIHDALKNYGLIYSAELVEKIKKGYHVF